MGIFGQSSPFDADVEKATSETNTNDNWSFILDVCDKVTTNPRAAKDCLKAIMKRMGHADPHVVMQAITLLDACANNCGKPFHLEVASREFETEFRRLLGKAQPKVSLKMRQVLKNWAENDFKNDAELNLIPSLYGKLRSEGYDFSNLNEKSTKSAAAKAASLPKDPNVVSSQQEEDDIAKAIELSLKETKGSPKQQQHQQQQHQSNHSNNANNAPTSSSASSAYPSLYPSVGSATTTTTASSGNTGNSAAAAPPEPRKVRALYDFEAAEENELTFFAGEIIHVLDDSDPNWWKGFNQRGEGLFPSNFVTADLSVDPERLDINQQHKSAAAAANNHQKDADGDVAGQQKTDTVAASQPPQCVEIDETKIDRLLHLLHEANPEDPSQDSNEMLRLEQEVHQMGPLIDAELERVDRKHAQLTQLSSDLVDAINLYHALMRDDRAGGTMVQPPNLGGFPGASLYGAAGYPSAGPVSGAAAGGGGFPPQGYPMHSMQYGPPPPQQSLPPQTTAATQQQPQQPHQQQQPMSMPYQNGHSLPIYSSPAGPQAVATQQTNFHMMPTDPQLHPLPTQPQFATPPTAAVTQPQPPQLYMSPQHHQQQQQPQPQPQLPPPSATQQQPHPSSYVTAAPPPQLYASNGPSYMGQPQQPPQPQPQLPPPQSHHHLHHNDHQYSQLHHQQQMAAMSMGQQQQQLQQQQVGAPSYLMQNDAVKNNNNIPIYQQQR